jgi:hypothetical protein
MEVYDPKTQILDISPEDAIQEEIVTRCFYLVRFNKTSNWHSVWLPHSKVSISPKFKPFIKKLREADQEQDRARCWIPQRILTVNFQ